MKDLKKKLSSFFNFIKKNWPIGAIFIFAVLIRLETISRGDFVFDYDQVEDLFLTKRIVVDRDPVIIGRPIYGMPELHHGVFFFYLNILPFILFKWNPISIAGWNSLYNALVVVILYCFAKSLFKEKLPALIAAIIAAVSLEMIQFSQWISSTTSTIFTVPLFFYGLWQYFQGKKSGLVIAAIFLGFSIQSELFFLYLIPVVGIYWLIFKPKWPDLKLAMMTTGAFLLSVLTMILTEFRLNFAGLRALINFGSFFNDVEITLQERFSFLVSDFGNKFVLNLAPQAKDYGLIFSLFLLGSTLFFFFKTKKLRKPILFLWLYLFSPAIMVFVGYHTQPWFLIGIVSAIALLAGFVISRFREPMIIMVLTTLIVSNNLKAVLGEGFSHQDFFKTEISSVLSSQLAVVDYTYTQSQGQPFAINTVTYPLYHNAIWDYHYYWYGKREYKYLPSWTGGDQLPLYDILPQPQGDEKYLYVILDNTYRVPEGFRRETKSWAGKQGSLVEEVEIKGFTVQKIEK